MRNFVSRMLITAIILAGLAGCADPGGMDAAAPRGTAEEAEAMVARAIAAYDEQGPAAFAAMTAPSVDFVDRDLYVFVVEADGTTLAHGADAGLLGSDVTSLTDAAGKAFGVEFVELATPDGAWVTYVWADPLTGETYDKMSWVVRHDGYIFGTGIYAP